MSAPIPIWLLEDDKDTRELLRRSLSRQPDFVVVKAFADAEALLAWLATLPPAQRPKVILVDWHLGDGRMDGIELICQVKLRFPDICCVLITAYDLEHLPGEAARSGADGFIFKSDSIKLLPARIRAALAGKFPLSAKAAQYLFTTLRAEGAALSAALQKLTACERSTLLRVMEGGSEKMVAAERNRSVNTIRNQLASAYGKLGVHNLAEAMTVVRGGGASR